MTTQYTVEFIRRGYIDFTICASSIEEAKDKALCLLKEEIEAHELKYWDIDSIEEA